MSDSTNSSGSNSAGIRTDGHISAEGAANNNRRERATAFLFECGLLKRIMRTGYAFLGQGKESVASHTFGVAMAALMLVELSPRKNDLDIEKLLKFCLYHDVPEARTGDANAVNKLYVTIDEESAIQDMTHGLPGGEEVRALLHEYRECATPEALLVHDADQLDMLLSLKENLDTGSSDAAIWIPHVRARLRTDEGRALAESILEEHWAGWWMRQLIGEDYSQGREG